MVCHAGPNVASVPLKEAAGAGPTGGSLGLAARREAAPPAALPLCSSEVSLVGFFLLKLAMP